MNFFCRMMRAEISQEIFLSIFKKKKDSQRILRKTNTDIFQVATKIETQVLIPNYLKK